MNGDPLRIVFVTPAYPPFPGGGERYAGALVRGLAAAGHHVTVITSSAVTESDFWNGVSESSDGAHGGIRIIRRPLRPSPGGRNGLLLWRKLMVVLSALPFEMEDTLADMARRVPWIDGLDEALAGLEADIIHAFNISWESGLVAAHAHTRRSGAQLVVTPFAHLGEGNDDRVARNSTMQHQTRILREAAKVLTLTRVEAEGLTRYLYTPDRIDVIGGGVDAPPEEYTSSPYFAADHHEAHGEFGLYIGRMSYDKGALHAADAVRALRKRGRNISLLLIGSNTPEFERYRRRLSPEDRAAIRPLGAINDIDKHAVLSRARFLMLPSRSDSFGIVLLEAWCHGVPVIAARAGGIPGVVEDGVNGLLVSFADVEGLASAAERIITDELFAQRLGSNGREKVEANHNWEAVVNRLLAQYELLLPGRSS
jgi:glycosyltransferase involved in cell wall biosynthesis